MKEIGSETSSRFLEEPAIKKLTNDEILVFGYDTNKTLNFSMENFSLRDLKWRGCPIKDLSPIGFIS
jgi:hypothetical protein